MATRKLKENIFFVGCSNPALRVFDIIMMAEYGTTYNSYLITGEKNVLVETVHERFFDEYLENISSLIDPAKIDYLIMNHTEPDHSGSIVKLLDVNPDITVVCTVSGKKFIDSIVNREYKSLVVKQGDSLDIGIGSLEFIVAPMLHWPDSMFTYFKEAKAIFTCDFLGAHYCEPRILDVYAHYPEKYDGAFAYYYAAIFGPFKPYVIEGLNKIQALDIDMACVSHGPVLTESLKKRMEQYREWSEEKPAQGKKKVAILHASAYGYTGELAKAAFEELKSDYDVSLVDIVFTPTAEAAASIMGADAVLVGSCTINRDAPKPVWDVLSSVDAIGTVGKAAGAFGSFGWSGEAVPMLKDRLTSLKFKFAGEGLRVNFRPNADDICKIKEYAREVASQIKVK